MSRRLKTLGCFIVFMSVTLASVRLVGYGRASAGGGPSKIYVDAAATGADTGSSWADAYVDLQAALGAAVSGTEIWVAQGTYTPGASRSSTFQLKDGVTLYGGFPTGGGDGTFGARDWRTHGTRLSGEIGVDGVDTDNVYHVVTAENVNGAILDGLQIVHGYADGADPEQRVGGGVYAPDGHPTLRQVTITDNFAVTSGGGAYFSGSDAQLSGIDVGWNTTEGSGGGIRVMDGGTFLIQDALFVQNEATAQGGGLSVFGGQVTVLDGDFSDNAARYGGGLVIDWASARLERLRLTGNSANETGGGILFGAADGSTLTLSNSLLAVNGAGVGGGGIVSYGASLALKNVTCSGNSGGVRGGAVDLLSGTSATFHNTILWGNAAPGDTAEVSLDDPSSLTLEHSLIEGGCPDGATCDSLITSNPLFYADPTAGADGTWGSGDEVPGDLRLWKMSPAIDAGNNNVLLGNGVDVARNPRRIDVASVADTGSGTAPIVDVGAYESPPDTVYVDQSATGASSGLTWTDALTDVQDALAWGASGPTNVWVAKGTYTPGSERDDSFHLVNRVALYGGFPPGGGDGTFDARDWRRYMTALSGEIGAPDDLSDNSYHVLVARNIDQTARVDGFVVTRGSADEVPSLSPLTVYCQGDPDYGGGLCAYNSTPILTRLAFKDNYALRGGGVELSESDALMANVEFVSNEAVKEGGGLHSDASELRLVNALFVGNRAGTDGGALWSDGSSLEVLNATVSGNEAGTGGALRNTNATEVALTNAIVWGNTSDSGPSIASDGDGSVTVDYSLLEGGCPDGASCADVLNVDPMFLRGADPGGDGAWGTGDDDLGDLRLQISSPALDAGDSDAFPGSISTDLLRNPRLFDVVTVPNTGTGAVPIDMGAYELANLPPVAIDDSYTTSVGTPLEVSWPGVLANDTDPEDDLLTAVKDSDPVGGTAVLKASGDLVYTPAPDATGVVSFTYHAHDGIRSSNVATVVITVEHRVYLPLVARDW